MIVKNMSTFARHRSYLVIRIVDGEAWFYDAWNDVEKAIKQAVEVGGMVIPSIAAISE